MGMDVEGGLMVPGCCLSGKFVEIPVGQIPFQWGEASYSDVGNLACDQGRSS